MINLTGAVVPRALDANGDTLSGALLYVYEAGTTTAVTTYTDSGGGTANAHPVVSDANGAWGGIYIAAQSVKVDIKTSAGVSLDGYPADDIEVGGDAAMVDTRAAVTTTGIPASVNVVRTGGYTTVGDGGEGIYYRQGSEPSHTAKVQSSDGAWWELMPDGNVVKVEQFGGSTLAAINAAIVYQNAQGGGVVKGRVGTTYAVNSGSTFGVDITIGVTLDMRGCILSGTGTGSIVRIGGSTTAFAGGLLGGEVLQAGSCIRGVWVTGNCRAARIRPDIITGAFSTAQCELSSGDGEICYYNDVEFYAAGGSTSGVILLFEGTTTGAEGFVNRNRFNVQSNGGVIGLYFSDNASTNWGFFTSAGAGTGIKSGSGTGVCNFNQVLYPLIESETTIALETGSNSVGLHIVGGNISMTSTDITEDASASGTTFHVTGTDSTPGTSGPQNFSGALLALANNDEEVVGHFSVANNRVYRVHSHGTLDAASYSATGLISRIDFATGNSVTATDISFTAADTISSAASAFGSFTAGDIIFISGTASNNGTFNVLTASASTLTVTETITTEAAGASMTVAGPSTEFTATAKTYTRGDPAATVIAGASGGGIRRVVIRNQSGGTLDISYNVAVEIAGG